MTSVRLKPIRDVMPLGASGSGSSSEWKSVGDDPGFLIALRPIRQRFLMIHLDGAGRNLDPLIYFDYGRGFSERHSVTAADAERHIFVIDVGVVGAVRAIRFDPATFPTRFSCSVESFSKIEEAQRRESELLTLAPNTRVQRLGNLNRLWLRGTRFIPAFRSNAILEHSKRLYAMAKSKTATERHEGGGIWLSVVVPVYNPPVRYLDDLVSSFKTQDIDGVQLILSDDGSSSTATINWLKANRHDPKIRIVLNATNSGIALCTNAGLDVAEGEWVALLDHDDLLAPHALKMIHCALGQRPEAQFLYTDELVVDDRLKPTGYMLKPAYDPVLLSGVNYINHLSVYRRDRLDKIGRLREDFEGSQDYDLLLRYLDGLPDSTVLHLPYPAYWWRRSGQTYSRQFLERATASARRALADRFPRAGGKVRIDAAITPTLHKVSFAPVSPKVSIIIPTKNAYGLISRILSDLYSKTDYPDFEVVVVDNGTTDRAVLGLYDEMRKTHANFSADIKSEPFNFARSINQGFSRGNGEHFLLLNNDVEIIESNWLQEMVSCLNFSNVGIVGAKLLFPNDTLQHAGVIVGFGGLAGHWFLGKPKNFGGPMNRLHVRSSMACVTGAVMLISGECKAAVGAMDEANFAVAYNDVDYCIRAYEKGFRTVWTPFATAYHRESVSRGSEKSHANKIRFETEKANLKRLHHTATFVDPAINPMYSRAHSTPTLKAVSDLPAARVWFARQNGGRDPN